MTAFIQILGAPIGGVVFDAVGAYWLYALALVGNLIAFGILFMFTCGEGRGQEPKGMGLRGLAGPESEGGDLVGERKVCVGRDVETLRVKAQLFYSAGLGCARGNSYGLCFRRFDRLGRKPCKAP